MARTTGATLPKGAFGYKWNAAELTRLRRMLPWLRAADSIALQQTLRDLDCAYAKFFAGVAGYPQPRRRGDDRYRVCGRASFAVEDDWVRLPKVGWLRFLKSRELPTNGRVSSVTVRRDGDHWMVSFCVEHPVAKVAAPVGSPVGLDLGVVQSVTFSDDTPPVHLPVATDCEEAFVRRLQRFAARQQRGSKRQKRTLARVAKWRRCIANRVRDAAHKLTTTLATTRSEIHIEDLRLRNMTASAKGTASAPGRNVRQKAGLNRRLLANAHGETVWMLTYKCERTGAKLVFKDAAHTSQECAECHHVDPLNRPTQAAFRCVKCGHEDNADRNAAKVVLQRPAVGLTVAAHRGKRKTGSTPLSQRRANPSERPGTPPGSTGIPVKEALAA